MNNEQSTGMVKLLPYLRRYARAVIGDQQSADAAVLATIQSLTQGSPYQGQVTRAGLYRSFTRIWAGPVGQHIRDLQGGGRTLLPIDKKLAQIPTRVRQVFLLSMVEEFDDVQIAHILDTTTAALVSLHDKAKKAIADQVRTDVLIIEDELFIATELEDIMLSMGHRIISIERTHANAVKAIDKAKPGLVLADVNLADGSSGLDAVNDIVSVCEVPVVFITSYPEKLLTGLRPEPTFILTKPFNARTVRAVVSQALFFESKASLTPSARSMIDLVHSYRKGSVG